MPQWIRTVLWFVVAYVILSLVLSGLSVGPSDDGRQLPAVCGTGC